MAEGEGDIYSATYSNVPVYELKINTDHVMRRRSDDWINATHILKIAGFDKPARTRILEREVQKGVHEKIQGGYGKYQGTWIPLPEGRSLAEKNGIFVKLRKIFEYSQGDRSPPPAPKHQTAASSRQKASKAAAPIRRPVPDQGYYRRVEEQYNDLGSEYNGQQTPIEQTPPSSPFLGDENLYSMSQASNASRKRKRGMASSVITQADFDKTMYGDELLDYFITCGDGPNAGLQPPTPPPGFDINKAIDSRGNTALHWACSMGDLNVMRDLIRRGANINVPTEGSGETPLIRAVLFTNNHDKETFPKLVDILADTIMERDWHGATVFHHIAETARSRSKWSCARYYCEVLITKLKERSPSYIPSILSATDKNSDTAVLCAVRNNCVKVATFLLTQCPEAGDIHNLKGETANELLKILSSKRQSLEIPPSSPLQPLDPQGRRTKRSRMSELSKIPTVSRAASTVLTKIGPLMEEASARLVMLYETEMKEKDSLISEAQAALKDFENQRHKIRQETYSLMAQAEKLTNNDQEQHNREVAQLRAAYEEKIIETQSLLEHLDHSSIKSRMTATDQSTPQSLFRRSNPNTPLTNHELHAIIPWAKQLHAEQSRRRELIRATASLMSEAANSERIGMHRKLVSLATGVKEEDLDDMAEEILDSLEGGAALGSVSPVDSVPGTTTSTTTTAAAATAALLKTPDGSTRTGVSNHRVEVMAM